MSAVRPVLSTAAPAGAMGPAPATTALRWTGWLLGLALFVAMCADLGLAPERLATGALGLVHMIGLMWPPHAAGAEAPIMKALSETLAMAFLGTLMVVLLSLPLALLGARTVVSQPLLHFAIRRVFDVGRGIPPLVWALVLVAALGMGPRVGVAAIVLGETPMMAKIFAEMLETRKPGPIEALRTSGASLWHVLRFGLVPQVLPLVAGMTLLLLEANVRTSAALGLVGAGGIGVELDDRIRLLLLDQVAWIMLVFIAIVVVIDIVSQSLRRRLIDARAGDAIGIDIHA